MPTDVSFQPRIGPNSVRRAAVELSEQSRIDPDQRAWLAGHPDLIAALIATDQFTRASPALSDLRGSLDHAHRAEALGLLAEKLGVGASYLGAQAAESFEAIALAQGIRRRPHEHGIAGPVSGLLNTSNVNDYADLFRRLLKDRPFRITSSSTADDGPPKVGPWRKLHPPANRLAKDGVLVVTDLEHDRPRYARLEFVEAGLRWRIDVPSSSADEERMPFVVIEPNRATVNRLEDGGRKSLVIDVMEIADEHRAVLT